MQTSSEPERQRPQQRTRGQRVTWSANQRQECPAWTNQKPAELLVMIYKSHQVASVFIQPINKFSNICSSADQGSDNGVDRTKDSRRGYLNCFWKREFKEREYLYMHRETVFSYFLSNHKPRQLWSSDSDHLKSENNETVPVPIYSLNILGQGRETESRVYSPSPQMYRQMVSPTRSARK